MEHQTTIAVRRYHRGEYTWERASAVCSCGWQGENQPDPNARTKADADAGAHRFLAAHPEVAADADPFGDFHELTPEEEAHYLDPDDPYADARGR